MDRLALGLVLALFVAIFAAGPAAAAQGPPLKIRGPFALRVIQALLTCTSTVVYAGTLEVELEDSGTSLNGAANLRDAYYEVVASTCTGPRQQVGIRDPWGMPTAPVRGTETSLSFDASDSVPAGDGSGPIARNYNFQARCPGPRSPAPLSYRGPTRCRRPLGLLNARP